jgi:hypothetical protein
MGHKTGLRLLADAYRLSAGVTRARRLRVQQD